MRARLRTVERSCCICRSKCDKRSLIRLVARDGALVVDIDQRLPGRGGYVHPTIECLSRMGQIGRWERALRVRNASLEASQVSQVVMELMTRVKEMAEASGDAPAVVDRTRVVDRQKKVRL